MNGKRERGREETFYGYTQERPLDDLAKLRIVRIWILFGLTELIT